jgi:formylglycine-generating enzyme required for sulfatase activity
MSNCGPGGSGIESCCTSLEVEGGTFDRVYSRDEDAGADGGFDGSVPATISTFRLDRYEVTVGRFRQFVNAWDAGYVPPLGSGKHTHLNQGQGIVNSSPDAGAPFETGWVDQDAGNFAPTNAHLACDIAPPGPQWATWTPAPGDIESKPMNCVTWAEAYAFCIWDGGFLPSASEWEYAAVGGALQYDYPWGNTPPGTSNRYAIFDCQYPGPIKGCVNTGNIAQVGTLTLGVSLSKQFDLVGNIDEWTLDAFGSFTTPCRDCGNLNQSDISDTRVRGGGSFAVTLTPPQALGGVPASYRSTYDGFRCARLP